LIQNTKPARPTLSAPLVQAQPPHQGGRSWVTNPKQNKEDHKMQETKPFEIPGILESLSDDVKSGKMTLEEAALELYRSGWMNFIDIDRAKRLLQL
jgi:hypothetical protein